MRRIILPMILIIALFVFNACDNKETEKKDATKTTETEKEGLAENVAKEEEPEIQAPVRMDTIDPEAGHPQYVISVMQGKKKIGKITIELYPEVAPMHVRNFDSLVTIGFFDGTAFHRVIPGFMIQGGDPNSKDKPRELWGRGDPTQTMVPAEFNKIPHLPGTISAARSQDPNSATSQFFICHASAPHLDGQYTAYGRVIDGMDVVDKIANVPVEATAQGEPSSPVEKVEMKITKK